MGWSSGPMKSVYNISYRVAAFFQNSCGTDAQYLLCLKILSAPPPPDWAFWFLFGFSKADFLEEEAPRLEKVAEGWYAWKDDLHGESFRQASWSSQIGFRGFKSVISLLLNYFPSEQQTDSSAPFVSKYAYGEDYHDVIRDKLKRVSGSHQRKTGHIEGRVFVDSAPVLDRVG